MKESKLNVNCDAISTDIQQLQGNKKIVENITYAEINQQKNCQDIKANWMLLTQTGSLMQHV